MTGEVKKSLDNLVGAFEQVAEAAQAELPDIWKKTVSAYGTDERKAVEFLTRRNQMLDGKRPLERALEGDAGKEDVLRLIKGLELGISV
ncbi:MAG: MbcA/ParS/Xre antitoxin family protein [Alphaproteobacteria bacterium]|nr:MbcA/ParS/Xre antitoxin family protein [Alphaproteobacteria bacterium]